MATTAKVLARGTLTDANATLYTTPSATTAIITSLILANITANAETTTIELDGVALLEGVIIPPNSTVVIDLRQVLSATDLVEGLASDNSAITYHISGVEVA